MTARDPHSGFTLHPPRSRHDRIEFDDGHHINYAAFWRGLAYGFAIVVPIWLLVFTLAWIRWGFGS